MPWEELGKSKVSIDQSNPGISNAVVLSGSNLTEGALDVYSRSVLDASQDSVAIAGALASSLARKPENIKVVSGKEVIEAGKSKSLVNTSSHIKIKHFEFGYIGTSGTSVRFYPKFKDELGDEYLFTSIKMASAGGLHIPLYIVAYETPIWEELLKIDASDYTSDIGYIRNAVGLPFVKSVVAAGESKFWKLFMRPNSNPIECPNGANWYLMNTLDTDLEVAYNLIYDVMPV